MQKMKELEKTCGQLINGMDEPKKETFYQTRSYFDFKNAFSVRGLLLYTYERLTANDSEPELAGRKPQ